jgi:hypothetical protein
VWHVWSQFVVQHDAALRSKSGTGAQGRHFQETAGRKLALICPI